MKQYSVTGMSCAACSARIEKAVSKVPGVESCSVSLLTNAMAVEGVVPDAEIIAAVEAAGYGAKSKEEGAKEGSVDHSSDNEDILKDRETPILKKRLIWSVVVLVFLMYISMGHVMWGFPLPDFMAGNPVMLGIIELILSSIVMLINKRFFISGFKSLKGKAPNMDTLVALGASASYLYSLYILFTMTDAQVKGATEAVHAGLHGLYFEGAAMILTLITVGKMLEAMSKGKTTNALKGLMKLTPQTATLFKDGADVVVPVESVAAGDIFSVKPGESIPVDGIVTEGSSAVDESALTGESIPVDKTEGDNVSAGTINRSGFIRCKALRVGSDTTISQIIKMVSDAAATKAPIARLADKVSGIFVPVVIIIAIITFLIWLLTGTAFGTSLTRAVAVLVISCPCALGLATPVAIMVGNGKGAKNGILFKTASSLEETGRAQIVVLDKTGTITKGEPVVTDVITDAAGSEDELLKVAYSLERLSEHPLARAVTDACEEKKASLYEVEDFEEIPGHGLRGSADGKILIAGNADFVCRAAEIDTNIKEKIASLAEEGKTPVLFAKDNRLIGLMALADKLRDDSKEAIAELKNMGIYVAMLTGDNEKTAKAIGREAGVDEVIAGVLPGEKEEVIKRFKEKGKTVMVGDGINDAPALTRADIGIAIGAGTDVAMDAAEVVLVKNSLKDVPKAIRLSRLTLRNIKQNLFWAFIYNIICIPLAAGAYISLLGWQLDPMFAALAMSLSSVCVVGNALRLNLFDISGKKGDKKIKNSIREGLQTDGNIGKDDKYIDIKNSEIDFSEKGQDNKDQAEYEEVHKMEKVLTVEGMMCEHCEARVKKALEAVEGVQEAIADHNDNTAKVVLAADVSDEVLKKAVEDQDYKVTDIA